MARGQDIFHTYSTSLQLTPVSSQSQPFSLTISEQLNWVYTLIAKPSRAVVGQTLKSKLSKNVRVEHRLHYVVPTAIFQ